MSDKDVKFYLGCREFSYVHGENEWRTPDNQYVMKRFYGHDNMTVIDSEGGIVARDLPSDFENISSVYIEDTPQRTVHLFDKGGKNAAGKTLVDYKKDLNCPDMSWIPDIVAGGLPPPITAADFISEETPAEFAERVLSENSGMSPQEASSDFKESPSLPGENKKDDLPQVHDKVNINFGVSYLNIFNGVPDIFKVDFGVDVTLLHRLVITPHISGLFTDPRSRKENDGSERVTISTGFEGGVGIGALAYRNERASLLLGADGLMGFINHENEGMETVGSALGKIEMRIFPPIANFGIGLSLGVGTHCSVSNKECYGLFMSGLQFFLPVGPAIH